MESAATGFAKIWLKPEDRQNLRLPESVHRDAHGVKPPAAWTIPIRNSGQLHGIAVTLVPLLLAIPVSMGGFDVLEIFASPRVITRLIGCFSSLHRRQIDIDMGRINPPFDRFVPTLSRLCPVRLRAFKR